MAPVIDNLVNMVMPSFFYVELKLEYINISDFWDYIQLQISLDAILAQILISLT